jgi:uncharacterized Zn ribbon protein
MRPLGCAGALLTVCHGLPIVHIVRPRTRPRASVSCLSTGDSVRIVEDVKVKGQSTLGWTGVVTDALERDVDEWGCCQQVETDARFTVRLCEPITGYFAENELEVVARGSAAPVKPGVSFVEGDLVRVVADVTVKGLNARSECGVVTSVWEICKTDPACCCAELATDAPIRVNMIGRHSTCPPMEGEQEVHGYFAEHELRELTTDAPMRM